MTKEVAMIQRATAMIQKAVACSLFTVSPSVVTVIPGRVARVRRLEILHMAAVSSVLARWPVNRFRIQSPGRQ